MNVISKLYSVFILIAIPLFLISYKHSEENEMIICNYEYALTEATRDATLLLRELRTDYTINDSYDGRILDEKDVKVDYDLPLERFSDTLYTNIGMQGQTELKNAFKSYIPVKGVISYSSLQINDWKGNWLPPVGYVFYKGDKTYQFTLGKNLFVYDMSKQKNTVENINTFEQIVPGLSNDQLRNYIIMNTINETVSFVMNDPEYNLTAQNTTKRVKLHFPHTDYENIDGNIIDNYKGNIIDSPCFFAVIDSFKLRIDNTEKRIFAIGGTQLELKD